MFNFFPPPQGDVGSNLIVAEMLAFNGGKGGQRQDTKAKAQLAQSEYDLFAIFWPTLLSKIPSLHPSFNYENRAKIRSLKKKQF